MTTKIESAGIIAKALKLRPTSMPKKYRDHRLVKEAPFFTLPKELLIQFVQTVGKERLDKELLEMELELSGESGDHASRIGFWGLAPISFSMLRTEDVGIDQEYAQALVDFAGEGVNRDLSTAIDRLQRIKTIQRGYLGWLLTNRIFLEEQKAIFQQWSSEVAEHGVPAIGKAMIGTTEDSEVIEEDSAMAKFLAALEEFFIRWRLEGMSAPFAPRPLGPHLPVTALWTVSGHMQEGGTTLFMPDIFPVSSRDELREVLEECLRHGSSPEHLAEWFKMVSSGNASRIQITRYARVFEVQHYLRALYGRHARSLKRKKNAVKQALSKFLKVNEDTIQGDIDLIARRLQRNDWHLAP